MTVLSPLALADLDFSTDVAPTSAWTHAFRVWHAALDAYVERDGDAAEWPSEPDGASMLAGALWRVGRTLCVSEYLLDGHRRGRTDLWLRSDSFAIDDADRSAWPAWAREPMWSPAGVDATGAAAASVPSVAACFVLPAADDGSRPERMLGELATALAIASDRNTTPSPSVRVRSVTGSAPGVALMVRRGVQPTRASGRPILRPVGTGPTAKWNRPHA
jgi:hypothetical protein